MTMEQPKQSTPLHSHATFETWFGPWCDECGGVPGDSDLSRRHIATIRSAMGALAIVWDAEAGTYLLKYPKGDGSLCVLDAYAPLEPLLTTAHMVLCKKGEIPSLEIAKTASEDEIKRMVAIA